MRVAVIKPRDVDIEIIRAETRLEVLRELGDGDSRGILGAMAGMALRESMRLTTLRGIKRRTND
jgi:hypothetical protein